MIHNNDRQRYSRSYSGSHSPYNSLLMIYKENEYYAEMSFPVINIAKVMNKITNLEKDLISQMSRKEVVCCVCVTCPPDTHGIALHAIPIAG